MARGRRVAPVSIYPVILSGGTGTRLWPLSRADFPKQFISFFDEQDETLLEATLSRLAPEGPVADPILLANERHGSLIREILARRNIAARPLLLEPVARNTAPSVTTAALYLAERKPGAVMAVMPCDHLIADPARFREQILAAAALAGRSRIVLFGVEAQCPHPGYGYLYPGAPLSRTRANTAARRVERFIEKPAQPGLSRLIAEGWLWNSGIFVMRAETLLEEMERADPDLVRNCRAALDAARQREGGLCLQEAAYSRCRTISLDHAVMERTRKAVVLPFKAGWK
ncbi:MAG: mannose-1-phosphate guanylyltransferase, partial [Alphaproteobacteria bacterium]